MKSEVGGRESGMPGGKTGAARVWAMLAGGDRRSIGCADEVAAMVLAGAAAMSVLFAALSDEDPVVQMRAADALEKVSAQRPEWLRPFKADFLALLPDFQRPEMRWHAAQMLPRLGLSTGERDTLALPVLLGYLKDESRLVQTFALQALADFAAADPALRPQVRALLEGAVRTGSPSVKVRSRRLLGAWHCLPQLR